METSFYISAAFNMLFIIWILVQAKHIARDHETIKLKAYERDRLKKSYETQLSDYEERIKHLRYQNQDLETSLLLRKQGHDMIVQAFERYKSLFNHTENGLRRERGMVVHHRIHIKSLEETIKKLRKQKKHNEQAFLDYADEVERLIDPSHTMRIPVWYINGEEYYLLEEADKKAVELGYKNFYELAHDCEKNPEEFDNGSQYAYYTEEEI